MDNWFAWIVGIYFLSMVLYGHYKGFVKLSISLVAGVVALMLANYARPYVAGYVQENDAIHQWVEGRVSDMLRAEDMPESSLNAPSAQRVAIENLPIPDVWKEQLLENNNSEIYGMLGVDAFADYVGGYLSGLLINIICTVLLFIVIFLALRLAIGWLNLLARLPVLYGLNHLLGALLGAVEALLLFSIFCLVIPIFSETSWGTALLGQIDATPWIAFLYHHNVVSYFLLSVVTGMPSP